MIRATATSADNGKGKSQRHLVKEPHCRSAQVWHALSRDFTVFPARPRVYLCTVRVDGLAEYRCVCLFTRVSEAYIHPAAEVYVSVMGVTTGDRCEVDIDDCATATCANNGTCIDALAEYTCLCSPGFTGVFCDVDIDECASAPCYNNATCHDSINSVL